ncbi:hypothetical protein I3843_02G157700 [Carya illinoinensis]|nr:hypothetical protein I3843_02G157700 [Carya illinoinensis]
MVQRTARKKMMYVEATSCLLHFLMIGGRLLFPSSYGVLSVWCRYIFALSKRRLSFSECLFKLVEVLSREMESSKRTSSVIARLMGLCEMQLQQPVQKQQRVLSEYYFQRVASIGVRGKRSSHEHPSFRMSNGEREELNYIFRVLDTLDRHKQHNLLVEEGKPSSNSSEERHNFPNAK